MDIARIDKATGVVVNIEVADQSWVDDQAGDPSFLFVPYDDGEAVAIGDLYDEVAGFPPVEVGS